ncbi:YbaB/EbfC family nucleoid-associated protein [Pseudomonas gozinkensis]|uniref:YbaB/EbfC family nucleoid-associated protein n=1 Tax=Pseudomonas gozinkensis TaxID=2774461 RepID=UPI001787C099|nr:YbaB/EbfC family nucleoid-associated protein [Pseudomonas gozinkensis]
MKVRGDVSQVAVRDVRNFISSGKFDDVERASVVALIEVLVSNRLDHDVIDLENSFFFMKEGSSLHTVWQSVIHILKAFVESEAFQEKLKEIEALDHKHVSVTAGGRMNVVTKNGVLDIAPELQADPLDAPRLQALVDAAQATGGELKFTQSVSVAQWLRFHDMKLPGRVGSAHKLLSFLRWSGSDPDKLGNYWEHIRGHDDNSVVLTSTQFKEIRALKSTLSPGREKLLGMLYKNVKLPDSEDLGWENANEVLSKLVTHPSAQALARKYVEALGCYGSNSSGTLEPVDLSQLLITVILLDLFPSIGSEQSRNYIGPFDIYQASDSVDKPMNLVRNQLEQYLVANRMVSAKLVPLASHLLLADLAPGFLVKAIPADLTVGSLAWVTFSQAVAFVETKSKGATRYMTYDQVMAFSDMDELSDSMGLLQSLTAIDPIIDWALINEVISHEELEDSAKNASERALSAYEVYVNTLIQSTNVWGEKPPSRKAIALEALKAAAPGCDFLEKPLLRPHSDQFNTGPKISMLDLHIEDELRKQHWDWGKDKSLYSVYPQLTRMLPNQLIFESAAREHHQKLHKALSTNIKLALARLPEDERKVYEIHDISFFTVRPPVGTLDYPSAHSTGLVGVNNKKPIRMETQAQRDEATGRFAVILYVAYGDNQYLCHEMFNLQGELTRNDELGELIRKVGHKKFASRVDFFGRLDEKVPSAHTLNYAPVDLESYTHGSTPRKNRTSVAVIEKLGTLGAPSQEEEPRSGIYQNFMSLRLNEIAQFIVTHRPLATVEEYTEAVTELTAREQARAKTDEVITYIVDLVVPFKKCIEDIASGDKNKLVDGLYGCTMDAISLLFTALGTTTKLLNIAARTVSTLSKLTSLGKYGLKLVVSTLNPLDGLPTAGFRLSKTLLKRGLRLSQDGARLVERAAFQLRRLTGKASSVDLLKLDSVPQLGAGQWRPRRDSANAVDVCAIARDRQWYAVSRLGRPWGKPLDFQWKQPFSVPDAIHELPSSYINHVIEKSIEIANRKIDNAIVVLTQPSLKLKTDPAIGMFLGTTPQLRDDLLAFLKVVKTDFNGYSASNVVLDPLKDHSITLNVKDLDFNQWKRAALSRKADYKFLAINPKNLNSRSGFAGRVYGEIADDLIHEMLRVASARKDVVIATTSADEHKGLNVTPLLNLASGHLKASTSETMLANAIDNADSCALATALLSQVVTDYEGFSANVSLMRSAISGSDDKGIETEVWLNLNTR